MKCKSNMMSGEVLDRTNVQANEKLEDTKNQTVRGDEKHLSAERYWTEQMCKQ